MDFIVFDPDAIYLSSAPGPAATGSVAFFRTKADAIVYRERLNKARKPEYATFIVRALKEV